MFPQLFVGLSPLPAIQILLVEYSTLLFRHRFAFFVLPLTAQLPKEKYDLIVATPPFVPSAKVPNKPVFSLTEEPLFPLLLSLSQTSSYPPGAPVGH